MTITYSRISLGFYSLTFIPGKHENWEVPLEIENEDCLRESSYLNFFEACNNMFLYQNNVFGILEVDL